MYHLSSDSCFIFIFLFWIETINPLTYSNIKKVSCRKRQTWKMTTGSKMKSRKTTNEFGNSWLSTTCGPCWRPHLRGKAPAPHPPPTLFVGLRPSYQSAIWSGSHRENDKHGGQRPTRSVGRCGRVWGRWDPPAPRKWGRLGGAGAEFSK